MTNLNGRVKQLEAAMERRVDEVFEQLTDEELQTLVDWAEIDRGRGRTANEAEELIIEKIRQIDPDVASFLFIQRAE